MTTARKIQQRMKQTGRKSKPRSILTIISDDHTVHCMTEDLIYTWWASLSPDEKADVYEEHLEAPVVAEDGAAQQLSATFVHATGSGVADALDQINRQLEAFGTFKASLTSHNLKYHAPSPSEAAATRAE